MDGLDIRETLRNWHTGELYVKVIPPSRGTIEVVVFLFDSPADPRKYTFRSTWFAEHQNESTLAFFATNPMANLIGPGIAQAEYGGALFLYPPRPIPNVWTDRCARLRRHARGAPARRRPDAQPAAPRRLRQPAPAGAERPPHRHAAWAARSCTCRWGGSAAS